ncbi:efflux RND transporter periplasmic adaptor subunit [Portibacter lacus]|uniref:RND transporter n=1 Tax=Portibacter lacus TaxID=1099794 RepID=A0AA37SLX2_9BACT|nr:efflux RND transporter periplasmic adaptor subunit [Portibacter lacus]GLR16861.1 RND transporter [Portibacter lacus]
MKQYLILIITTIVFFASCGEAEKSQSLDEKKSSLTSLKKERADLDHKIKALEQEIEKIEPSAPKARKLVTTDTVVVEDFKRYIDIQGSVESGDAVFASAEIGGRITSMDIEEGDYVKSGSLVAVLDVQTVKNQIIELEKSLELATDIFKRQERLWNQEIGSEVQFLQAKNNKERIEKSLESVQFQLTKANVYAPLSGYAETIFLKKGELAGPGAPIIEIINTNTVKIVADVPETLLGKVKKGEYVEIEFPALQDKRKGRVSLIGRSIDSANRTFKVEVDMANTGNKLKPNLLSIMKINDLTVEQSIAIPLELVQQEISGKDYVFVVGSGADGAVAEKKYVKTGPTFEDQIVIEEGLQSGDQIIVDGARGLSSDELIKIQ